MVINNFYKKMLAAIYILLLGILLLPAQTHAQGRQIPQDSFVNDLAAQLGAAAEDGAGFDKPSDPRTIVVRYINVFLGILGVLILIYIVYGGYMIMTSAGESSQVDQGKSIIKNAIIGLAVVLAAYSITTVIVRIASGDIDSRPNIQDQSGNPRANTDPLNRGSSPNAFNIDNVEF